MDKTTIESPIGKITLGSDVESLIGLWTDGQKPQISGLPLSPIGGKFRQAVWKMLTINGEFKADF